MPEVVENNEPQETEEKVYTPAPLVPATPVSQQIELKAELGKDSTFFTYRRGIHGNLINIRSEKQKSKR